MSSRLISDLEPITQGLAIAFLADCAVVGDDVLVTCTRRSPQEQDALWAQGRTVPGKIVTRARGNESPHNFGMALDIVPMIHGKPVWDIAHPSWQRIAKIGQTAGLEWGGSWVKFKDYPHFQRPGWRTNISGVIV